MALIKITFDSASVTSKQDADINHFCVSSQNGVFAWVLGRCLPSYANNYITFQSGYVQVYGRRIFVEAGTKIGVALDKTAYGYVFIKIDLSDNSVTLDKKENTSTWPSLTQEDLRNGGLIYEFPLCRYTKTTSSFTLDTSFAAPTIVSPLILASDLVDELEAKINNDYGPLHQSQGQRAYEGCWVFDQINGFNAYNGIITVYVGGCNVVFYGAAVGNSGGVVHYYYDGRERTLDMQLAPSGLYIEPSDGSEPKYVRVVR